MNSNLTRLPALLAALLVFAACGDDQKDFEPSEEEIQNALSLLSGEYAAQDPTLCECFFADFGYNDAATCERDRAITADETTCVLDAFLLNRANAGEWLTCQINTERVYSACIDGLTCTSPFDSCNTTRTADAGECPSLAATLNDAWTVCQEPSEENAPEEGPDLGDTIPDIMDALYSAYLQEDAAFCGCFEDRGFASEEVCLRSRGYSNAEFACRIEVYESHADDGLTTLECQGRASVTLAACLGNAACGDWDAAEACDADWRNSMNACPDLPGSGEADNAACIGIPDESRPED